IENSVMPEAIRSIQECAASLSIPSEPVSSPVTNFRTVTIPAAVTEKTAAERFAIRSLGFSSCIAAGLIREMLQVPSPCCATALKWATESVSLDRFGVGLGEGDGVVAGGEVGEDVPDER